MWTQTHTHTHRGLENCHACWHCHAWRMALSTVLHATESQRVCERRLVFRLYPTMIQEGWMSHRQENNTPARSLKTKQKTNTTGQEIFGMWEKKITMNDKTDGLCSSHNDNMIKEITMHTCMPGFISAYCFTICIKIMWIEKTIKTCTRMFQMSDFTRFIYYCHNFKLN